MTPDDPDPAAKLRRSASLIEKAAELFGVAGDDIVKVSNPGGPEVPMRLDDLLMRMEKKAKKLDNH